MIVGIPRETQRLEHRVGLTPFAVASLVRHKHQVVVQHSAGAAAHFTDQDYVAAGAEVVYDAEQVFKRADVVCQVNMLGQEELALVKPGLVICGFHHLAVAPRPVFDELRRRSATLIGYEIIEDEGGDRPILLAMSDLAGQMAIQEAAHLLQITAGGRGVLLGNVPGVPAPTVLILGAGTVGTVAAQRAVSIGASVIVLDADVRKLQRIHQRVHGRIDTAVVNQAQLARLLRIADVVIGAVLIPGGRAPFLVTEDMVRTMRPGSVIVDVSIDQGGCVETSRPTTLDNPTFTAHGVVHYCVPNMSSNISRTASRVLSDAALPYVLAIAGTGLESALQADPGLAAGVYAYKGRLVHKAVASHLHESAELLSDLLERGGDQ
ncbi:MAG: alanine dehydrogenase [Vicinamibacteraceae bacterium]|nr:alanine dehydrogenase [Vicinamibacteraceae bacterium]